MELEWTGDATDSQQQKYGYCNLEQAVTHQT